MTGETLIGGLIGSIIVSILFVLLYVIIIKPRLKETREQNELIQKQNQQAQEEYQAWQTKKSRLIEEVDTLTARRLEVEVLLAQANEDAKNQYQQENQEWQNKRSQIVIEIDELNILKSQLESEVSSARASKEELLSSIEDVKKQVEDNAKIFYEKVMANIQDRLSEDAEKVRTEYQTAIELSKNEYLKTLEENVEQYNEEIHEKKELLHTVCTQIEDLQEKLYAIIAANKRAEDENKDEYRLDLSELDKKEIFRLREIIPYLREARPLNKMIWEGYYQKPYKDLVARVVGEGKVSGIYKLTNLTNGKSYIGQAVDISGRWSEHIKKGLGIDTNNQILYVAMRKDGPENFSYEIIETCPSASLNEKEKYWINYFKTMEYGYNMKVG